MYIIKNVSKKDIKLLEEFASANENHILDSDCFKIKNIKDSNVYIDSGYTYVFALEYIEELFQIPFIYDEETNNNILTIK